MERKEKKMYYPKLVFLCIFWCLIAVDVANAKLPKQRWYPPETFDNPILPGDHPDLNLYAEGEDFYVLGSSFSMSPYVEILHSTDLLHWERVSRVVSPEWSGLENTDSVEGGTWGGFIVKIEDGYRVYFAVDFQQHFVEGPTLAGPWSDPVMVEPLDPYVPPGAPEGVSFNRGTGYDDSVFIDDDGTTYLLVKAGQCKWSGNPDDASFGINLLQEIDPTTGQLIPGTTIDLSFVNWNVENAGCGDPARDPEHADTSHWSEGPTMTKRDGYYYYFVSTNTECGGQQYVWRSTILSSNNNDWTPLGRILSGNLPFSGAQHMTSPIQLEDGTWWAFVHSYDCNGWQDLGRQGLLTEVTWIEDPNGGAIPTLNPGFDGPMTAPFLPPSGIPFLLPISDDFSHDVLDPAWTFYAYTPSDRYSLTDRPGYLTIKPAEGETRFVVQKDALHDHAMIAKMDFIPTADKDAAGIRIGSGIYPIEDLYYGGTWRDHGTYDLRVARTLVNGTDQIKFSYSTATTVRNDADEFIDIENTEISTSVAAPSDSSFWLKLVRNSAHQATAWFSINGLDWTQVGDLVIDISEMDDYWTVASGWVGTQVGMFATNKSADFDYFTYRDAFSVIPAIGTNQQSGTTRVTGVGNQIVLGDIQNGDWAMYGSLDFGTDGATAVEIVASSLTGGTVEVWTNPWAGGQRIARCPISPIHHRRQLQPYNCDLVFERKQCASSRLNSTRSLWEWLRDKFDYRKPKKRSTISGIHDIYLRFLGGSGELFQIASIQFIPCQYDKSCPHKPQR
jgi:xylan 1,4-beta-xylosidase